MKKKGKKKAIKRLPRYIRGELRMACAMRGFSDLKSGKPRRPNDQYSYMARFFHGSPPNYPSQIKLLSEGRSLYRDIFEEETVKNTKKRRILTMCGFFASKRFSLVGREGCIIVVQIFGGRILKRKIGWDHYLCGGEKPTQSSCKGKSVLQEGGGVLG